MQLALRPVAVADHELAGQRHAENALNAEFGGQFDVKHAQRDRQALAVVEHFVHVAVAAVGIVASAAVEAVFLKEIAVEALHGRNRALLDFGIVLQVGNHGLESVQIRRDVDLGVVVTREQQRAAQQIDLWLGFSEFGEDFLRHGAAVQLSFEFAQLRGLIFELLALLADHATGGGGVGEELVECLIAGGGLGEIGFDLAAEFRGEFGIERLFGEIGADAEAAEVGHGGAEFAQAGHTAAQASVVGLDDLFAVHEAGDLFRLHTDAQRVPLACFVGLTRNVGEDRP